MNRLLDAASAGQASPWIIHEEGLPVDVRDRVGAAATEALRRGALRVDVEALALTACAQHGLPREAEPAMRMALDGALRQALPASVAAMVAVVLGALGGAGVCFATPFETRPAGAPQPRTVDPGEGVEAC